MTANERKSIRRKKKLAKRRSECQKNKILIKLMILCDIIYVSEQILDIFFIFQTNI